MAEHRVHDVPAVRGDLRTGADPADGADHPARAATATTCSAAGSSARRAPRSASSTPTRTGCARPACAATACWCRPPGTRRSPRSHDGLTRVIEAHGRDAVALYLGNPNVHTLAGTLFAGTLRKALGSRNVFTASTVDQMPKHVSCGYLFGSPLAIPVPDVDRTDFLLMLGADPYSSNGSLWTVPDAARPAARRCASGAAGSSWSTRGAAAPPAPPTGTCRSARAPTRSCCSGMVHELFARDLVALGRAGRRT